MTSPLLSVRDLKIHFNVSQPAASGGRAVLKAVDGVSMDIERGKTLALVGESGCGKSTTGYGILGLASVTSGEIHFDGKPLSSMQPNARHDLISNEMQIVFQDPSAALNPKMSIADSIGEPLKIRGWSRPDRSSRVAELMELVGLSSMQASRFPNEISGGQRQRVVIARALALSPKLIVCDEPVSALDVSIRSQVLNILMKLQRELNLSYLFISHDLSVVRHIADEVAVMYLGTIVERGKTDEVYGAPRHPYTEALLSAIPLADPVAQRLRKKIVLSGEIPSPLAAPSGCPFVTRCPIKVERCWTDRPQLEPTTNGTDVACHERRG
ncbi:ABC transporter ATP-binding protein [Agrobacterium larrymoorei]|uniref:ATP-binding cassette domain-containing protein n=1 Tax=Agrobacterium larrymoorei TaxID=160699 RepID=A0ABX8T7W2_9HYPH|nr:oligopeptide/dipeptide ABC transporter ATP-binding protein [Agrobacterium larrymoorei]QYA08626.1 ATP-binding cassette domain-containing protein [Agrobacterium larrymoorei]